MKIYSGHIYTLENKTEGNTFGKHTTKNEVKIFNAQIFGSRIYGQNKAMVGITKLVDNQYLTFTLSGHLK